MITMNSNDWFLRTKIDREVSIYPITIGNLSISGYGEILGTEQAYPTGFYNDYYLGDLHFTFQQTE